MSDEGKSLVQARYAIRNNQRNFLKITLPPNAVIWSATLSGKPIRPGQTPDGGLLLPLEKTRAGEEAPAFVADIFYFYRGDPWKDRGKCKLAMPVLDLPVSTTGLEYFYPPFFKVTPEPGSFRTQAYQDPVSAAFSAPIGGGASGQVQQLPLVGNNITDLINVMGGVIKSEDPIFGKSDAKIADKAAAQVLVDRHRSQSQDGKRAGILPIQLDFPAFGPSMYLVSELTAENQSPAIEINFEADKKGGSR